MNAYSLHRVMVQDERLDWLVSQFQPQSVVPAFLQVTDIAGLVRNASQGEGLGNAFLSHIRAVDGIVHVARVFQVQAFPSFLFCCYFVSPCVCFCVCLKRYVVCTNMCLHAVRVFFACMCACTCSVMLCMCTVMECMYVCIYIYS